MKKKGRRLPFGYMYLMLIPVFAIIYTLFPEGYIEYGALHHNFWINLYLSAITVTTLGFGDVTPLNEAAAVIIGVESVLGVVFAGLFLNQIAHDKLDQEKKEEMDLEITKERLRESDRLLQFAGVIRRIESTSALESAVKDFILNIDLHDYRVLERVCMRFISDGKVPQFKDAFEKEVMRIEEEYAKLKKKTDGQYWG